ncbi:hypothetical protein AABD61_04050 [Edwardsiella piscicida]|uniref:hypothetical protein n=1 Tax=Edwardsiella piscicida TaxID=1263550 RepID=UPI00370D44A0
MITFTKEQLIASAHARIEFAEMMLSGELEPLKERTWSIELELARIALASLETEPVAMSDHRFRELVNTLRDIAIEYHGTQQLREHIARACRAAMPVSAPQQEHDHG